MALQKDFETDFSYTANYWRVCGIFLNKLTGRDTIEIFVYKDKTSRDNNKKPISVKQYNFPFDEDGQIITSPFTFEEMNKLNNNVYKIAYNWLKSRPAFEGAIDVLED
jgi:hypothetical protein